MTMDKGRLFGGLLGMTTVLAVASLLLGWDYYAKYSGSRPMVKLVTTPLGDLDRTRRPPSVATVVPPPMTGGTPQALKNTPVEKPVAEVHAPRSQDGTVSPRLDKPRAASTTLAVSESTGTAADTATRKEREAQPVATATGIGMQAGAIVANGRQAPELRLLLTSTEIVGFVAAKRAVVTVESDGGALYFLDRPDGPFRPMNDLSVATISNRYVAIADPGLVSSWLVRLGQLPSNSYKFGLRFTKSFDATIVERQFASLVERGIDFEQALTRRDKITTYGSVAEGLEIVINKVSVEESPRDSAE